MRVNPVIGQLICHDTPASVVDQDVDPIGTARDLVRCLLHFLPVCKVAFQPSNLLRRLLSHLFLDGIDRTIDHFFGTGEDEEFLEAVGEKCVAGTVTNPFRSTGDDGNFALEVGRIIEVESLVLWHQFMSPLSRNHCQHVFSKACKW